MPRSDNRRIYYCYVLFDWLGTPRWIGKGKNNRMFHHERSSDYRNWLKNEFIEQTWLMLGDIPKVKIQENLTENEAFELEITFIRIIGRFDQNKGPLLNLTDGGEGMANSPQPKGLALIERNAAVSRGHQRRTPEEKEASNALRMSNYPPGYWNKKAVANWISRSPEDQRAFSLRGSKAASELGKHYWINDGFSDKRIKSTDPIPDGWRKGRTFKPTEACWAWVTESRWINNGLKAKRIACGVQIPDGWSYGRSLNAKLENLCKCGCGKKIEQNSTYARGHYPRIKRPTREAPSQ